MPEADVDDGDACPGCQALYGAPRQDCQKCAWLQAHQTDRTGRMNTDDDRDDSDEDREGELDG